MKIKPLSTGYEIETPKKQWFSWGWLIFWIIVFFPIAIIYILIKMGERK